MGAQRLVTSVYADGEWFEIEGEYIEGAQWTIEHATEAIAERMVRSDWLVTPGTIINTNRITAVVIEVDDGHAEEGAEVGAT